jgi:hypothetical protein
MSDLTTNIVIGILLIILAVVFIERALLCKGVDLDFITAFRLFESKCATTNLRKSLGQLQHLPKLKGFHALDTLLSHRHRARATKRLKKLQEEWKKQELKIYRRKT